MSYGENLNLTFVAHSKNQEVRETVCLYLSKSSLEFTIKSRLHASTLNRCKDLCLETNAEFGISTFIKADGVSSLRNRCWMD